MGIDSGDTYPLGTMDKDREAMGTTQGPAAFDPEELKRGIGRAAVVILNGRDHHFSR